MAYRHASRADHSDLASGQVLRSAPGYPGFPVRLADELFQRAAAYLPRRPARLWDPCCGSGYLVTVLGLLHRERLRHVLASDISTAALELTGHNLRLLTVAGLVARGRELRARAAEFDKPGYRDTAVAAERLAHRLEGGGGDLPHDVVVADAFRPDPPRDPVDLVLTDVPYGRLTDWSGAAGADGEPVPALARAVAAVLPGHAVVVITARARKLAVPGARPLERVRVGQRAAVLLRAGDLHATDRAGSAGT